MKNYKDYIDYCQRLAEDVNDSYSDDIDVNDRIHDNQINIDWMKPSKTYLVAEKLVFLACLASWGCILWLILFS